MEAINAYTAIRSHELAAAGIRINCVNPGPTEELAWPLVFLNSPHASSLTGTQLTGVFLNQPAWLSAPYAQPSAQVRRSTAWLTAT